MGSVLIRLRASKGMGFYVHVPSDDQRTCKNMITTAYRIQVASAGAGEKEPIVQGGQNKGLDLKPGTGLTAFILLRFYALLHTANIVKYKYLKTETRRTRARKVN